MKVIIVAIITIVLMGAAGYMGFTMGAASGKLQVENSPVGFGQRAGGGFQPGQGGGAGFQPGQSGNQGTGQSGNQGAGQGARPGVAGTIKSINGDTLEVTEANGATVNVKIGDQTTIQKTATAAVSDIKAGVRITVTGDTSSGTINARIIQVGAAAP